MSTDPQAVGQRVTTMNYYYKAGSFQMNLHVRRSGPYAPHRSQVSLKKSTMSTYSHKLARTSHFLQGGKHCLANDSKALLTLKKQVKICANICNRFL